jgi:hypothetical protein
MSENAPFTNDRSVHEPGHNTAATARAKGGDHHESYDKKACMLFQDG